MRKAEVPQGQQTESSDGLRRAHSDGAFIVKLSYRGNLMSRATVV